MTWGRFEDDAPFHRKWLGLSNDAVAVMWRTIVWARSPAARARPGFVTEKELQALSGGLSRARFRTVLAELLEAGKPAHEHGLLERTEGGFEIHDFHVYGKAEARPQAEPPGSPTPPPSSGSRLSRSEAARRAGQASAEARRQRTGTARPPRADAERPERRSEETPNVPERRLNDVHRTSRNVVRTPTPKVSERRSTEPEPDPERTSDDDPKTLDVRSDERSERSSSSRSNEAPNNVPERPRSLAEALRVPLQERAKVVEENTNDAEWVCPHQWPEVQQVAAVWGNRRLAVYKRDTGVQKVISLFAAGFTVEEVVRASQAIQAGTWATEQAAKGRRVGMTCLSPENVSRELEAGPGISSDGAPPPVSAEETERFELEVERQRARQVARGLARAGAEEREQTLAELERHSPREARLVRQLLEGAA